MHIHLIRDVLSVFSSVRNTIASVLLRKRLLDALDDFEKTPYNNPKNRWENFVKVTEVLDNLTVKTVLVDVSRSELQYEHLTFDNLIISFEKVDVVEMNDDGKWARVDKWLGINGELTEYTVNTILDRIVSSVSHTNNKDILVTTKNRVLNRSMVDVIDLIRYVYSITVMKAK